jgi:hypothetical protein
MIGGNRNAFRILMGKLEGKKLLGRLRPRWDHNIERILEK